MVHEDALLQVMPEEEADFELAFAKAKTIIEGMPGFQRRILSRCIESPNTYLLLVAWEIRLGPAASQTLTDLATISLKA